MTPFYLEKESEFYIGQNNQQIINKPQNKQTNTNLFKPKAPRRPLLLLRMLVTLMVLLDDFQLQRDCATTVLCK